MPRCRAAGGGTVLDATASEVRAYQKILRAATRGGANPTIGRMRPIPPES
jgi:hypothetical protein